MRHLLQAHQKDRKEVETGGEGGGVFGIAECKTPGGGGKKQERKKKERNEGRKGGK